MEIKDIGLAWRAYKLHQKRVFEMEIHDKNTLPPNPSILGFLNYLENLNN